MIRTQVYLPETLHRELTITAAKKNKPTAQLIRDLLQTGLNTQKRPTINEALLSLTRVNGHGPKDLSTNLDDYLYGDKE